jgi:DNA-binding NarL/FixJ family response regulator
MAAGKILNRGVAEMNGVTGSTINIYLLVHNRLVCDVLLRVFRKRSGLTVVGTGYDRTEAFEKLAASPCDVLLLDSLETLRAVQQMIEADKGLRNMKVMLFGMDEDPESFLKAVRMGACGYLLNEVSAMEMISAVRRIAIGEAVCPPKLCKFLFKYVSSGILPGSAKAEQRIHEVSGLTCRQRQLMALVAKGMTNKEIAERLHLSEFTVKNHIRRVMTRLRACSRHQAVDAIRTCGLSLSAQV